MLDNKVAIQMYQATYVVVLICSIPWENPYHGADVANPGGSHMPHFCHGL